MVVSFGWTILGVSDLKQMFLGCKIHNAKRNVMLKLNLMLERLVKSTMYHDPLREHMLLPCVESGYWPT